MSGLTLLEWEFLECSVDMDEGTGAFKIIRRYYEWQEGEIKRNLVENSRNLCYRIAR